MNLEDIYNKTLIMEREGIDISVRAGICLLFQSGVRISSILGIRPGDISKDGRVLLRQGKGSAPQVVMPLYYREFFKSLRNLPISPYAYQNYMYYYRLFKKYMLCGEFQFGMKNAVTSTARKEVANDMYNTDDNIVNSAIALGHRRISSTEYYIKGRSSLKQSKHGVLAKPYGLVENLVVCKNGVLRKRRSI